MPKQEQSFVVNNNQPTELAISYEVLTQLKWSIDYAGADRLVATELGSGLQKGRQIVVICETGKITVISETADDQMLDIGGRNKKNVTAFIQKYDAVKNSVQEETLHEHYNAIELLREKTARIVNEHRRDAEEVEATMKMGSSNLYVTYGIIAINVIIFILMTMQGGGIFEANGLVHIKWGSNYGPLTLTGDWWRLFTCMFLHFGIIHLAMNMYALFSIGMYLEPMLGKGKYIIAYVCSGILASLVSLWWHSTPANSAGASGAIFGMYGLFLAMLTTDFIPASIRKGLLTNIAIFVGYNLIYGTKGTVDNSAHIGGLVSGIVIGYLYVLSLKKEKQGQKLNWVLPLIVLATIGISAFYVEKNQGSKTDRASLLSEISISQDDQKFEEKFREILAIEDSAIAPYDEKNIFNAPAALAEKIRPSIALWNKTDAIVAQMESLKVSDVRKKRLTLLKNYIQLRKQETDLRIKFAQDNSAEVNDELLKVVAGLNAAVDSLGKIK